MSFPADCWIDPSRPVDQRAGHPRPCRPCARRARADRRHARRRWRSWSCATQTRDGRDAGRLRRDDRACRAGSTRLSFPPATCSARRRSCSSMPASGWSSPATTSAAPTRPARRSRSRRATCSSPRRRSACRCSAIRRSRQEIAKLLKARADQSRALRAGRRLCAGQGAAGDRRAAPRRPPRADLPARRDGADVPALRGVRRRPRRPAAGRRHATKDELRRRDRGLPALGAQRPLEPPPARSDHRDGVGLDARAPARPAAQWSSCRWSSPTTPTGTS